MMLRWQHSFQGTCVKGFVYNAVCTPTWPDTMSILQTEPNNPPVPCMIYEKPNCKGVSLLCDGSCASLFVLELKMHSMICTW
jgi:hypothetical protein